MGPTDKPNDRLRALAQDIDRVTTQVDRDVGKQKGGLAGVAYVVMFVDASDGSAYGKTNVMDAEVVRMMAEHLIANRFGN